MTRVSLNRTLRAVYSVLFVILAISIAAKFADRIPGIAGTGFERAAADVYEFFKDMSLLLVTVVAAFLANVFQKRSKFVGNLEEEWRGIVKTKTALYTFCEKPYASTDDYLSAFCRISETIDNMRIVYCNAGETQTSIGLYPYAPLHDMRRVLQSIDPRKRAEIPAEEKAIVRDAILQSFYALRENFLEELDLEQPVHPLLISGGRRLKSPGASRHARGQEELQRQRQNEIPPARPDIEDLLMRLYEREQANQSQNAEPDESQRP
jgi:hypothetical protein